MRVHLSFDVEVWCNDWTRLDEVFPVQFERYIYARTKHGEYALPATLDILRRHGLTGVFFVEPLFSARFGAAHLEVVVGLIRAGNHEVQLHIHPEWVDEIEPAVGRLRRFAPVATQPIATRSRRCAATTFLSTAA